MRLHPIQVSRPPRTGAGLLPGGVGAGVPDLTAGKLKEYKGGDAKGVDVARVEGGVVAIFAFAVGISLLESKSVAKRTVFEGLASGEPPPVALFLFFFSLLSRSSQPFAIRWHSRGGHLAASRALSPGAPFGHSRVACRWLWSQRSPWRCATSSGSEAQNSVGLRTGNPLRRPFRPAMHWWTNTLATRHWCAIWRHTGSCQRSEL